MPIESGGVSSGWVGDANGPPAKATTRTNITVTGDIPWREVPLRRSGLFGPVRVLPVQEVVATP